MQGYSEDPGEREVRAALATLVATEPELPSGVDEIERRGRRRRAWRQVGVGASAATVVAAVALAWPAVFTPDVPGRMPAVAAPTTGAVQDPAGGSQLASGFPIGEAVAAVAEALPAGTTVAELPRDIGWQEGGVLNVPLAPSGMLTLVVSGTGNCSAQAAELSATQLAAVADRVCAVWRAGGSLPVIPAGAAGAEQPDLAAQ